MASGLPYDPSNRQSIVEYATKLVGHSLRDVLDELPPAIDFSSHKGGFGTALERHYFHYEPNNRAEPDFAEAGVELKATPLKRVRGGIVPKERLVLGMIDYMTVISEEWESSSFLRKNAHLLLVFYLHEAQTDPRDFVIRAVRMWDFPEEDLELIRRDWETIVRKVRLGIADEISERDTKYLAACVKAAKGSDRIRQPNSAALAKPRAYSLKPSYVRDFILADRSKHQSAISADELRSPKSFEEIFHERFQPYLGMTADAIASELGVETRRDAKNFYAVLTKRILGVDAGKSIAEFAKAGIIFRTIRLRPNGTPKEAVSFKAFDYVDLVTQEWDESDLRNDLNTRFFFVIYQLDRSGTPRLLRTQFWTMPEEDVEKHGRECFERTVQLVREDRVDYLPSSRDNSVCHVRPHGRNKADTLPTPTGGRAVKRSFWLNQSYLAEQLRRSEDS